MSRMSQLHAELTEQAYELGFESIGEAEQAGYGVDWEKHKLLDPQDLAHRAWLEERDKVIEDLDHIARGYLEIGFKDHADVLCRAIKFIKGCHE